MCLIKTYRKGCSKIFALRVICPKNSKLKGVKHAPYSDQPTAHTAERYCSEMGKNPHLLGSVLFGFYDNNGSVGFGFF